MAHSRDGECACTSNIKSSSLQAHLQFPHGAGNFLFPLEVGSCTLAFQPTAGGPLSTNGSPCWASSPMNLLQEQMLFLKKFGDFCRKKKTFPQFSRLKNFKTTSFSKFLISLFGGISPVIFYKRLLRNLYKKALVLTYLASVSQSQRDFTPMAAPAFACSSR